MCKKRLKYEGVGEPILVNEHTVSFKLSAGIFNIFCTLKWDEQEGEWFAKYSGDLVDEGPLLLNGSAHRMLLKAFTPQICL